MPFSFNLKISTSCETLSKNLDMSKKTLLISNPLSKDVKISWVIDNSWLTQESPAWKPDWFLEMSLIAFSPYLSKNVSSSERVKPRFLVTFNIIINHFFPEISLKFLNSFRRHEDFPHQY